MTNTDYEMSVIHFLPFIHASPSEYSKLLTAINQSVSEDRRLKMQSCTYDLYLKAHDVIGAMHVASNICVTIRLGGFHTLMSLLGSIGFIMKGLMEALLSVYGENTIKKS